ncbi:hypothetical protein [Porticoccus sp.]
MKPSVTAGFCHLYSGVFDFPIWHWRAVTGSGKHYFTWCFSEYFVGAKNRPAQKCYVMNVEVIMVFSGMLLNTLESVWETDR